jgi:hypothetical protein
VLLKIRHIHDTHYWAWQTRLAIIACLPGTPLWLVFVYSNTARTAKINNRFVPAGWFLPGLITMQFVTIFFPLLDAIKSKRAIRQLSTASSADAPTLTPSAYKSRAPKHVIGWAQRRTGLMNPGGCFV